MSDVEQVERDDGIEDAVWIGPPEPERGEVTSVGENGDAFVAELARRGEAGELLRALAGLDEIVRAAHRDVRHHEAELRRSCRELISMKARMIESARDRGRGLLTDGDAPDPSQQLSHPAIVEREKTPYGRRAYVELVDLRVEAELLGAREKQEEAEAERDAFIQEYFEELQSELRDGARAERRAVLDAARELAEKLRPVEARDEALVNVFTRAGEKSVPDSPFEGLIGELRRLRML